MNHAVLMISAIITTNEPFLFRDLAEVSETAHYLRIDRTLRDEYTARYTARTTATVGTPTTIPRVGRATGTGSTSRTRTPARSKRAVYSGSLDTIWFTLRCIACLFLILLLLSIRVISPWEDSVCIPV